MRAQRIRHIVWAMALASLLAAPAVLAQHEHGTAAQAEATEPGAKARTGMGCPGHSARSDEKQTETQATMSCKEMMAHRKQMVAKLQAMDATLQELVERMSAAQGEAKIEAMEAVLRELVAQRTSMRSTMMKMQEKMMRHMMAHMGGMKGAAGSSSGCPMMKDMMKKESTEQPASGAGGGSHAMHH